MQSQRASSVWFVAVAASGMFREAHDWGQYPTSTFRIYQCRGKGPIRAGEDVAIYYSQESKWMKCDSKWCSKGTCPGYPNTAHSMESSGKWQQCSEYVFKIYARGRKLGQIIQANDAILLYTLGYSKWVSVYNGWIAQGTCPGTERPPSLNKYNTCSDAVFELWKKMNH